MQRRGPRNEGDKIVPKLIKFGRRSPSMRFDAREMLVRKGGVHLTARRSYHEVNPAQRFDQSIVGAAALVGEFWRRPREKRMESR